MTKLFMTFVDIIMILLSNNKFLYPEDSNFSNIKLTKFMEMSYIKFLFLHSSAKCVFKYYIFNDYNDYKLSLIK